MAQRQTKAIENSGVSPLIPSALYSLQVATNGATAVDTDITAYGLLNPPAIVSAVLVVPVADGGSVAALPAPSALAVTADATKIRIVLAAAVAGSFVNILFQES